MIPARISIRKVAVISFGLATVIGALRSAGGGWCYPAQVALSVVEPKADAERLIVFVHGILGSSEGTFSGDFAWPAELAGEDDFADCAVATFTYPSEPRRGRPIGEVGEQLMSALQGHLARHRNLKALSFICHGMGGLVVKEAMLRAAATDRRLPIAHVVFLGTPHLGAQILRSLRTSQNPQFEQMHTRSEYVLDLNARWVELVGRMPELVRPRIYSALGGLPVVRTFSALVVNPAEALCGIERASLTCELDHMQLGRPTSREGIYAVVRSWIMPAATANPYAGITREVVDFFRQEPGIATPGVVIGKAKGMVRSFEDHGVSLATLEADVADLESVELAYRIAHRDRLALGLVERLKLGPSTPDRNREFLALDIPWVYGEPAGREGLEPNASMATDVFQFFRGDIDSSANAMLVWAEAKAIVALIERVGSIPVASIRDRVRALAANGSISCAVHVDTALALVMALNLHGGTPERNDVFLDLILPVLRSERLERGERLDPRNFEQSAAQCAANFLASLEPDNREYVLGALDVLTRYVDRIARGETVCSHERCPAPGIWGPHDACWAEENQRFLAAALVQVMGLREGSPYLAEFRSALEEARRTRRPLDAFTPGRSPGWAERKSGVAPAGRAGEAERAGASDRDAPALVAADEEVARRTGRQPARRQRQVVVAHERGRRSFRPRSGRTRIGAGDPLLSASCRPISMGESTSTS